MNSVPEEAAASAVVDPIPAGAAVTEHLPGDTLGEDAPLVEDPQREPAGVGHEREASALNEDEIVGQAAAEGDGMANR